MYYISRKNLFVQLSALCTSCSCAHKVHYHERQTNNVQGPRIFRHFMHNKAKKQGQKIWTKKAECIHIERQYLGKPFKRYMTTVCTKMMPYDRIGEGNIFANTSNRISNIPKLSENLIPLDSIELTKNLWLSTFNSVEVIALIWFNFKSRTEAVKV